MKTFRTVGAALFMGAVLFTLLTPLSGCQKEGPEEQAGKSLDDAENWDEKHLEDPDEAMKDAANGDQKWDLSGVKLS